MSPRPSRLALALGATALAAAATATTATTAHAAPAGAYKLVYVHNYQDANALAECRTAGIAGVSAGRWDYYRCIELQGPTYVQLQGWLNIS
ncbi:hypothetical protein GCM10009839_00880 [Catenulispora yoronensis]|uniref:Uncharacterized protein n=1 Tax=Catenulispora yoronensis TaxID=450799 RepID=A0ABN2TIL0_9ACTN